MLGKLMNQNLTSVSGGGNGQRGRVGCPVLQIQMLGWISHSDVVKANLISFDTEPCRQKALEPPTWSPIPSLQAHHFGSLHLRQTARAHCHSSSFQIVVAVVWTQKTKHWPGVQRDEQPKDP